MIFRTEKKFAWLNVDNKDQNNKGNKHRQMCMNMTIQDKRKYSQENSKKRRMRMNKYREQSDICLNEIGNLCFY